MVGGAEKYEGPWQMHLRDIDPSCFLKSTAAGNWWNDMEGSWWFLAPYDDWDSEPDDILWLKSENDLPDIDPLIEVTNPEDASKWLILDAYYKWESPNRGPAVLIWAPRRLIYG